MDHMDNKHCTETKFSCRYHYKTPAEGGSVACGVQDNPTTIQLRSKNKSYPSLDFEMPRQRHDLEKVESMMSAAYDRGVSDARAAIGRMMKELIAL